MAYARRKSTRTASRSKRSYGSTRSRRYAPVRRRTVRRAVSTRRTRRPSRAASAQHTVRIVIQNTGLEPEARPNLQTALLGASAAAGPKKARQGGGN